jgi:tRNA (cmo5U34)-methyltransferase
MKRDEIFLDSREGANDFQFDAEVAQVFDDMVLRSVPFYLEQQRMVVEIAKRFWISGSSIYDLGCSTGTTLLNIAGEFDEQARLVGYDNSVPMLDQARMKIRSHGLDASIELRRGDLNGDLSYLSLTDASVVTMCWVLQFVQPPRRDRLIKWVYDGLAEGGVLVVTEKVVTHNTCMNSFFVEYHSDLKRRNGYSDREIVRKREALEKVLVPYRIDENLAMFRRNGFEIVETFFQWYNFAGFLCVKKPKPADVG